MMGLDLSIKFSFYHCFNTDLSINCKFHRILVTEQTACPWLLTNNFLSNQGLVFKVILLEKLSKMVCTH